jgi:hypothetical protein
MNAIQLETPDTLEDQLDKEYLDQAIAADNATVDGQDGPKLHEPTDNGEVDSTQAETIEIKFRKRSKASATIRVFDEVDGVFCRVDWKSADAGGSNDSEVCATPAEAIDAALTALAVQFHGNDKALADLGKFRTKFENEQAELAASEETVKDATAQRNAPDDEPFLDANTADEQTARDAEDAAAESAAVDPAKPVTDKAAARAAKKAEREAKMAEAVVAYRERLQLATTDLVDCTLEEMQTEAAHKAAKAARKLAAESLQSIVNRGPESYPLWEGNGLADKSKTGDKSTPGSSTTATDVAADADSAHGESNGQGNAATDREPNTDQSWRSVSIDVLDLGKALTEKLAENDIHTIGQLEDKRASGGDGIAGMGLRSIKGVGQAKVDKIEDAVLSWLSKNRDRQVLAGAGQGDGGEAESGESETTDSQESDTTLAGEASEAADAGDKSADEVTA